MRFTASLRVRFDPHEYEPKPTDISETTQADVIFHNGLNLETGGSGWFSKLIKTAHKKDREQVFEASDAVTPLYLTTNQSEQDPHTVGFRQWDQVC